jgi:hypothetical protein
MKANTYPRKLQRKKIDLKKQGQTHNNKEEKEKGHPGEGGTMSLHNLLEAAQPLLPNTFITEGAM